MHLSILEVRLRLATHALWALPALAAFNAAAAPTCPRGPLVVVEHFIGADCERCWQTPQAADGPRAWRFDWIVPAPSGDAAPLAMAALPEGLERAGRAGAAVPAADASSTQRSAPAARRSPLRLAVRSGPAWNNYIAVQYELGRGAPADASVWVALVERIPADSEGSPVARELVRAVAGPYRATSTASADGATPMVAMRVPATPQPQRLAARAWVEAGDGRIVAIASEECPSPAGRP